MSFWLKWFNSLFTFVLHTKRARYLLVIARFSCLSNLNVKQEKNEWSCGCNAYTCTVHIYINWLSHRCHVYSIQAMRKKMRKGTSTEKRSHSLKKNRFQREKLVIKKADGKFSVFISNVAHHRPRIVCTLAMIFWGRCLAHSDIQQNVFQLSWRAS